MRLCLFILLLVLCNPAMAARGFGTTFGVAVSDKVVTGFSTSLSGPRTYAAWVWINGNGGGGFGRIWDKRVGSASNVDFASVVNNVLQFSYGWTGSANSFAGWSAIGTVSNGAWHHIAISYDDSSTANVPKMYIDGVLKTVNTTTAPAGSVLTNADAYVIGNRANDSARNLDGQIAEFCIWDTILTNVQVTALWRGVSPMLMSYDKLRVYYPLTGDQNPESDLSGNHYSSTVTGTQRRNHAPVLPTTLLHTIN